MDDEIWATCSYFESYEVSSEGRIRSKRTGLVRNPSFNQRGVPYVTLWDPSTKRQVNRAIGTIVGETFLEKPSSDFNTILYLNANRGDVAVHNLMWRPRAFVYNFHRQVGDREGKDVVHEFECIETGTKHASTYRVAMAEGVLPSAIFSSILNNDQYYNERDGWRKFSVFPTGKSYRSIGRFSFRDMTGM